MREAGLIDKYEVDRLNGKLMDEVEHAEKGTGNVTNTVADKERFFSSTFFKPASAQSMVLAQTMPGGVKRRMPKKAGATEEEKKDLPTFVDEAH